MLNKPFLAYLYYILTSLQKKPHLGNTVKVTYLYKMQAAFLLTWAFSLLVQACLTGGLDSSCSSNTKDCIDVFDLGPDRPSIVVIDARGRLGNHLMAYALVKALALDHGVVPLVTRETRDYLRDIFEYKDNNEVSVLENSFCNSRNTSISAEYNIQQSAVMKLSKPKSLTSASWTKCRCCL